MVRDDNAIETVATLKAIFLAMTMPLMSSPPPPDCEGVYVMSKYVEYTMDMFHDDVYHNKLYRRIVTWLLPNIKVLDPTKLPIETLAEAGWRPTPAKHNPPLLYTTLGIYRDHKIGDLRENLLADTGLLVDHLGVVYRRKK